LRNQANNPKHEIKVLEYLSEKIAQVGRGDAGRKLSNFCRVLTTRFRSLGLGLLRLVVPRPARAKSNLPDRFQIRGCHGNAARTMGHTSKIWTTTTAGRYPMPDSDSDSPPTSPISGCWMPPAGDYLCNRRARGNKWWSRCFHFQFSFDCCVLHKEKITQVFGKP